MKSQLRQKFIQLSLYLSSAIATNQYLPKGLRRYLGHLYGSSSYFLWRNGLASSQSLKSPSYHIARLLKPGDIYVDIGASFGETLTIAQKAIGSSGYAYAFEPQPEVFQLLTYKKESFGWDNVTLVRSVIGDRDGECTFFEDQSTRMSSISSNWAGGSARVHPITRLDTWASSNQVKDINLVKVDVEGAEMLVIRGGRTILRQARPSLLLEINNRTGRFQQYGYTIDDLLSELRGIGYDAFYALRVQGLDSFTTESELLESDRDMLAIASSYR